MDFSRDYWLQMDEKDRDCLERYSRYGDDEAFTQVVRAYLPMVHAAAMRMLRDAGHAEDISQRVFTKLARNPAPALTVKSLPVWFHGETRSFCISFIRSETSRRKREILSHESALMLMNDDVPVDWSKVAPVLDDLVRQLPEHEQAVILERYFQGKSHGLIAQAQGITEDACRMRVKRGLEKIRVLLERRGITASAAALTTMLQAQAATAPPVGLAATIAAKSLASASSVSLLGFAISTLMTTSQKYAVGAAVLLMLGTATVVIQKSQSSTGDKRRESSTTVQAAPRGDARTSDQLEADGLAPTARVERKTRPEAKTPAEVPPGKVKEIVMDGITASLMDGYNERLAELTRSLGLSAEQRAILRDRGEKAMKAAEEEGSSMNVSFMSQGTLPEFLEDLRREDETKPEAQMAGILTPEQETKLKRLRQEDEFATASIFANGQASTLGLAEIVSSGNLSAVQDEQIKMNADSFRNYGNGFLSMKSIAREAAGKMGTEPPDREQTVEMVREVVNERIEAATTRIAPYLPKEEVEQYRAALRANFDQILYGQRMDRPGDTPPR